MKFPIKKKKNPEPSQPEPGDDTTTDVTSPPPIPPFRTFVVRQANMLDEEGAVVTTERVIDNVHGFDIGNDEMVAFFVYFHYAGKMMQTVRYLLVLAPGDEVEEIHAAFGEPVKH